MAAAAAAVGVSSFSCLRPSLLRAAAISSVDGAAAGRISAAAAATARAAAAAAAFHTSSSSRAAVAAAEAARRGNSSSSSRSEGQTPRLGVKGRSIFAGGCEFIKEKARRIYDSFFYSQGSTKYVMLLLFPAAILYTRFRADTKLGYYVFINDESIYPDYEENYLKTKWTNGKKFYVDDHVTVEQFKQQVYNSNSSSNSEKKKKQTPMPENIKVSCRGRVFDDSDNLALAVRAFCRRDPRILFFQDDL